MRLCYLTIICLAVAAGSVGAGAHEVITTRSAPAETSGERFLRGRELGSDDGEDRGTELFGTKIYLPAEQHILDWLKPRILDKPKLWGSTIEDGTARLNMLRDFWLTRVKSYNDEFPKHPTTFENMLKVYSEANLLPPTFDPAASDALDSVRSLLSTYLLQKKPPKDVAKIMKLNAAKSKDWWRRLLGPFHQYVLAYNKSVTKTSLLGSLEQYDDDVIVGYLYDTRELPRHGRITTKPVLLELIDKWLDMKVSPDEVRRTFFELEGVEISPNVNQDPVIGERNTLIKNLYAEWVLYGKAFKKWYDVETPFRPILKEAGFSTDEIEKMIANARLSRTRLKRKIDGGIMQPSTSRQRTG